MKSRFLLSVVLVVGFTLSQLSSGFAQSTYVGSANCKMCHNKAATGKQYSIWAASNHAKAFEVLASDEAKAVAQKAGIEGDPQQAAACVSCHVTGYGVEVPAGSKLTKAEGVSCEACHGAGSAYKGLAVMKQINTGAIKGETVGLVTITEKTCITCHNPQSLTYKEFKFDEAAKKIAHPIQVVAE
jgi:hypothetical protein